MYAKATRVNADHVLEIAKDLQKELVKNAVTSYSLIDESKQHRESVSHCPSNVGRESRVEGYILRILLLATRPIYVCLYSPTSVHDR